MITLIFLRIEWCESDVLDFFMEPGDFLDTEKPLLLMDQENFHKMLCPIRGSPLGGFGPEDTCMGVRCLSCDYVGAVTTNTNLPSFDQTPYSIWVDLGGEVKERLRVIAASGVLLGIGIQMARDLIENGKPVRVGMQAEQVQRLYQQFQKRGINIQVAPEFPWRLERDSA